MLATLYNVFRDEVGLNQFAFANADLHTRINQAVWAQLAYPLPYYVLDPIPVHDAGSVQTWLEYHQALHAEMDQVLGIAGNDLSDVDFRDADQVASWVWLHAQEHRQANSILGLT